MMSILKQHSELSDMLNEFERDFVATMERKQLQMWDGIKDVPDPGKEAMEQYDALLYKVTFLKSMVERTRQVLRTDAVIVNSAEAFLSTCDTLKVFKPDGIFRSKLMDAQAQNLGDSINKLKEVYNGTV